MVARASTPGTREIQVQVAGAVPEPKLTREEPEWEVVAPVRPELNSKKAERSAVLRVTRKERTTCIVDCPSQDSLPESL